MSETMLDTLGGLCKQRITGTDWPDFGRTATLNVAYYCTSMNSIPPDQECMSR